MSAVTRDVRWWELGACLGLPVGAMEPKVADHAHLFAALSRCRPCPVTDECLAEALDLRDYHGVRGGMTGMDRARLAAGVPVKQCRCGAGFVPQLPHQVRCRLCTQDPPGDVERTPCPVCGRNVGKRAGWPVVHRPVGGTRKDPPCPGGGKPPTPEPERTQCPVCGKRVGFKGSGLTQHWRPGESPSAGHLKCRGTGSVL